MTEISCARCGDTDGPFENRGDHYVCEGCITKGGTS